MSEPSVSWQSIGGQCSLSIMSDWCAMEMLMEESVPTVRMVEAIGVGFLNKL